VTYLVLPDEGHSLGNPVNRLRFAASVEAFLAAELGGRAEPPAPEEEFRSLLR
jgi:dipeptidyl aminopeptidase/acylaminoacyl peptidase